MEKLLCFFLLVLSIYSVSAGNREIRERCLKKTKYYGCIYFKSYQKCFCTTRRACQDPFKFKNKQQCMKHVIKQKGACKEHPCENQAKCNPLEKQTYQCDCTGTGFYGKRCHKVCPKTSDMTMEWLQQFVTQNYWKNTPIACITK